MNSFAALSDKTRREIVRLVAINGELTSTQIGNGFQMSKPAISQHLKVLKDAKVLDVRKEAQKRLYSINDAGIEEIGDWLIEIKQIWIKRLGSLDNYLEKVKKERSREKK